MIVSGEAKLYQWIAWTANRERIADCGTCWAHHEREAKSIAAMCLGGPHMRDVTEFQVEPIAAPWPHSVADLVQRKPPGERGGRFL